MQKKLVKKNALIISLIFSLMSCTAITDILATTQTSKESTTKETTTTKDDPSKSEKAADIPDIAGCWKTTTNFAGQEQISIDTFKKISGNTYKQTTDTSDKSSEATFEKETVITKSTTRGLEVVITYDINYEGNDKFIITNPQPAIIPGEFKAVGQRVDCP